VVPFESLGTVSYSPSEVIMALQYIVSFPRYKRYIGGRKSRFFIPRLDSTPLLGEGV